MNIQRIKSWLYLGCGRNVSPALGSTIGVRHFGQPASQTHPHLMLEGEVTPGMTKTEFYDRRSRLVQGAMEMYKGVKSVKDHLFIFPSSSTTYMTNDIPYVFRQNTDFLYFSGFQEPDSILIIEGNCSSPDGEHLSKLFVPERNKSRELWDGPRSGAEGAVSLTGVDAAFNYKEIEKYLQYYNSKHSDYVLWYDSCAHSQTNVDKNVVNQLMNDKRHKCVDNPTGRVHTLRSLKSPAEIQLMQRSCEIASQAFIETMTFSHPKVKEAHLWAKMDFECRLRGAEYLAYPPVVAGGPRANTIHYITNNQVVEGGDMVLMDAGCELHGYASDLTRTWPVNGKFTKPQKDLYNATLRVNEACIRLCTTSNSLDEILLEMCRMIGEELVELGIIPSNFDHQKRQQLSRIYCPHHIGHYLGMDVHDTGLLSRRMKLVPGMVITIEPGLYIPADNMDVSPEYRGIGIRIEDNILVTSGQPVNMSASCPKTVEDIENLMAKSARTS